MAQLRIYSYDAHGKVRLIEVQGEPNAVEATEALERKWGDDLPPVRWLRPGEDA